MGVDIATADPEVAKMLSEAVSAMSKLWSAVAMTKLNLRIPRLVDDLEAAYSLISPTAFREIERRCGDLNTVSKHEAASEQKQERLATARENVERAINSIHPFYHQKEVLGQRDFLRENKLPVSEDFVQQHQGPKQAAIVATAMLFELSESAVRDIYNKYHFDGVAKPRRETPSNLFIDHPFDRPTLLQSILEVSFNVPREIVGPIIDDVRGKNSRLASRNLHHEGVSFGRPSRGNDIADGLRKLLTAVFLRILMMR